MDRRLLSGWLIAKEILLSELQCSVMERSQSALGFDIS